MEKELPKGMLLQIAHSQITNSSRIIHKGPAIITGLEVSGKGGDVECNLYDGESVSGDLKAKILAVNKTTTEWSLTHPVDFDKGIYIKVSSDKCWVTVCYIPESWKKFV